MGKLDRGEASANYFWMKSELHHDAGKPGNAIYAS
jgi:hypothetical protein